LTTSPIQRQGYDTDESKSSILTQETIGSNQRSLV
jgi:hypothetical protein